MSYADWPTHTLELAKEVQIAKYNHEPHDLTLQDIGAITVELARREGKSDPD